MPLDVTTPNGVSAVMYERLGTSDGPVINGMFGGDEYRLGGRHFSGWALDIGSHVGSIAVAFALDNPDLRVVAVEPVPDNCEVIRVAIAENELSDRVFLVPEAAAEPGAVDVDCWWGYTSAGGMDDGYVHANRFVGNIFHEPYQTDVKGEHAPIKAVSLGALLDRFGIDEVAICKTDCEGAEFPFFSDPARVRVREIVGEWHGAQPEDLVALLGDTHEVEIWDDLGGTGRFRAVRR